MKTVGFVALLVVPLFQSSLAQQAVLTAVKDNTLYQTADGSTSNGAGQYLFAGRVAAIGAGAIRRGLLTFDVAAGVPTGASITSVSLRLNMSKTTNGAQTVVLKKLSADWGEGASNADLNEGSGGSSVTGDATWLHRFKATSNWTTAGGDFVATESASLSVNATGAYTWNSTPQLVADVQGWLTSPSTNFGWIVIGNEAVDKTTKRFDSRENATTANRPQLTVIYTTSTSVDAVGTTPSDFGITGNYPNPFNPETKIGYRVVGSGNRVSLRVFNLFGQEVAWLVNEPQGAGTHTMTWNAHGMPSGIYFAVLEVGGLRDVKRMVLAK